MQQGIQPCLDRLRNQDRQPNHRTVTMVTVHRHKTMKGFLIEFAEARTQELGRKGISPKEK